MKGFYRFITIVLLSIIVCALIDIYQEIKKTRLEIQMLEPKIEGMFLDKEIEEMQKDMQKTVDRIKAIS